MPARNIYFSEKELEFIQSKPNGYVRELVKVAMQEDGIKKIDYKTPKSTSELNSDFAQDVYSCKECGQVLCAGKCINKFCKRFKKSS